MPVAQKTQHSNSRQNSNSTMLSGIQESSEECVRDHPMSSTMIAFGAGAAIGLVATLLLNRYEEEQQAGFMSRLSHQVANTMGQVVPDSFRRR